MVRYTAFITDVRVPSPPPFESEVFPPIATGGCVRAGLKKYIIASLAIGDFAEDLRVAYLASRSFSKIWVYDQMYVWRLIVAVFH